MAYARFFQEYTLDDLINDYFYTYLNGYLDTFINKFKHPEERKNAIQLLRLAAACPPNDYIAILKEALPKETKIHAGLLKLCNMMHGSFSENDQLYKYKETVSQSKSEPNQVKLLSIVAEKLKEKLYSWLSDREELALNSLTGKNKNMTNA